jgi:hypothetical protein
MSTHEREDGPRRLERRPPEGDPLGLVALSEALDRLVRLRDETLESAARPARWVICVDALERTFHAVAEKYELLRDRYALLKRGNSQLADELSWLRDQCDDLASGRLDPLAEVAPPPGSDPAEPEPER